MLDIDPAARDQRLRQRDHHLRIIGIRAATAPRLQSRRSAESRCAAAPRTASPRRRQRTSRAPRHRPLSDHRQRANPPPIRSSWEEDDVLKQTVRDIPSLGAMPIADAGGHLAARIHAEGYSAVFDLGVSAGPRAVDSSVGCGDRFDASASWLQRAELTAGPAKQRRCMGSPARSSLRLPGVVPSAATERVLCDTRTRPLHAGPDECEGDDAIVRVDAVSGTARLGTPSVRRSKEPRPIWQREERGPRRQREERGV